MTLWSDWEWIDPDELVDLETAAHLYIHRGDIVRILPSGTTLTYEGEHDRFGRMFRRWRS